MSFSRLRESRLVVWLALGFKASLVERKQREKTYYYGEGF